MNLLDEIFSATTTSPRIISEQHDLNAINVSDGDIDRALSGLGRVWDAAEMGISRERAAQMVREAQTPEARERVISELKARALRRASLDTSNGRVNAAFANTAPWHGLGVVVDGAMSSRDAIRLAGLDWKVDKTQLEFTFNGTKQLADSWGIIRADTGSYLGTVGSRYKPVQNIEGFDFLDTVIGEYGAKYESAGSIYGGQKVWMLAQMPQHAFSVSGDQIEPYVLFTNCHDGSGAAWCYPTTVRVECANTFRTSGQDKSKGLSIRHTGDLAQKITSVKSALGLAVQGFETFKRNAAELVAKKVDPQQLATSVLDEIFAETENKLQERMDNTLESELAEAAWLKHQDRRREILGDIMDRYESERCSPKGTAWAAFNAITEHADHNTIGRQASDPLLRQSRRFESTLAGERDEIKQVAYAQAMAL